MRRREFIALLGAPAAAAPAAGNSLQTCIWTRCAARRYHAAMAWLLRKSAALLAVYSIALQALLLGFLPAHQFGFDPFAVICSAQSSGDRNPSRPQHASDCEACLPACSSTPALVPARVTFAPVRFADGAKRPASLAEAPSLQRRHQPHASRAPPSLPA
jgi:hypothetical protein